MDEKLAIGWGCQQGQRKRIEPYIQVWWIGWLGVIIEKLGIKSWGWS
jgi:hypothetical protein